MANEQFTIDLGDQQAVLVTDDDAWLREKLRQEPGATRIRVRYDEDEVEGHRYGAGLGVRVIADDLDTEGHAIALHFPSREEADAFRKRLMLTGVLAGTVALGTAAGIGLANMSSPDAGTSGAVTQSTVSGSDWSQVERPPAAIDVTPGSAWTPDERQDTTSSAPSDEGPMLKGGPIPR
jgi:hypothetical protein